MHTMLQKSWPKIQKNMDHFLEMPVNELIWNNFLEWILKGCYPRFYTKGLQVGIFTSLTKYVLPKVNRAIRWNLAELKWIKSADLAILVMIRLLKVANLNYFLSWFNKKKFQCNKILHWYYSMIYQISVCFLIEYNLCMFDCIVQFINNFGNLLLIQVDYFLVI